MSDVLDEIVRRLERLEAALSERTSSAADQSNTISSPFKVIGKAGNVLLKVSEDGDGAYLHLYSGTERLSITLGCTSIGGFVDVLHLQTGKMTVSLEAKEAGGRIEVCDNNGRVLFDSSDVPTDGTAK